MADSNQTKILNVNEASLHYADLEMVSLKQGLLKRNWRLADETAQNGGATFLAHDRHLIGTVVPAAFLYEHHRRIPTVDEEIDDLVHLSKKSLKQNPDAAADLLNEGKNIIVLDKDDMPIFAIANKLFSVGFSLDQEEGVSFRNGYMFNDNPLPEEAYEEYNPRQRRISNVHDARRAYVAISALEEGGYDQKEACEVIRNLPLTLD